MTIDTDTTQPGDYPKTIGPVEVEWNTDLDEEWQETTSIKFGDHEFKPGEGGRVQLKGRCSRCWGGLMAKRRDEYLPQAIRCRVCGVTLEGDEARDEYRRMSNQTASNTFNMAFGQPAAYHDDAIFVQKPFPYIERQSAQHFQQSVTVHAAKGRKDDWLTRGDFPAGSAGFLFLQARALISGIERLPREMSVAAFSDVDLHDDGSATVHLSREELGVHSNDHERQLMARLGSTMTIALTSAFACELAMKAIGMTLAHEARKTHDLWKLFRDIPDESTTRLEADFPEIGFTLKAARHTFDKWRYFEANVGGRGIGAMIDTEKALGLSKAARVLLDEAEMVGLGFSVRLDATQRITKTGDRHDVHVKHRLHTKGTEAPPMSSSSPD